MPLDPTTKQAASQQRRWLVVDTDAGVDDAVALCLALRCASRCGFELKLLTATYGNVPLDRVTVNVPKCRRACGMSAADVPICVGAGYPLLGGAEVEASFFHGADGLGDVDDPTAVPPLTEEEHAGPHALSDEPALDALLRLSCEAAAAEDTSLHVVTLGPLTNLALALRRDPTLANRLGSVVVMGGCGNGHGNASPTSEFNIRADPESAAEVFEALARPEGSEKILSVVSWELTEQFPLSWDWFDGALPPSDDGGGDDGGAVRRFLSAVVRDSYGRGARKDDGGAIICDALAVAVCLDRAAVVTAEQTIHCAVECAGVHTRGQTVCDWDAELDGFPHEAANVRWITGVNIAAYQKLLDETLAPASPPSRL